VKAPGRSGASSYHSLGTKASRGAFAFPPLMRVKRTSAVDAAGARSAGLGCHDPAPRLIGHSMPRSRTERTRNRTALRTRTKRQLLMRPWRRAHAEIDMTGCFLGQDIPAWSTNGRPLPSGVARRLSLPRQCLCVLGAAHLFPRALLRGPCIRRLNVSTCALALNGGLPLELLGAPGAHLGQGAQRRLALMPEPGVERVRAPFAFHDSILP
jgi:hypothetical protein